MDTHAARLNGTAEHIGISILAADKLLLLYLLQRADLVSQTGCSLELKLLGRQIHLFRKPMHQLLISTFKKLHRMIEILTVRRLADHPHTRGRTALDLVLQAGSRAIAEKTVFTLPDAKHLLQQIQTFSHRTGAGIGSEITPLLAPGTALKANCRVCIPVGYQNIGIGFIVAQQNVVWRTLLLDQVLFQQQRFRFTAGYRDLNPLYACNQCLSLAA